MPFSTNDLYFPPYKGMLEMDQFQAGRLADPYVALHPLHGEHALGNYGLPSAPGPSGNSTSTSKTTIVNVPADAHEPSLAATTYWDQDQWHHTTGEPSTSIYSALPYAGPEPSPYGDFQEQGAGTTTVVPIADICQLQHTSLAPWHISAAPDINVQSAGPSTSAHEQSTITASSSTAGPTVAQSLLSMEEIQKIKDCRIGIYLRERKRGSVPVEKAVKVLEETNLIGGILYLGPSGDSWLKRLELYTNTVVDLLGGEDFIALLFGRACDACMTAKEMSSHQSQLYDRAGDEAAWETSQGYD
ncbi:hypothetical protein CERSUDRAFT_98338 [Gelatoporia subvermispora B]|uniref:Uncharacterized protein n=1 Tax=Ceriporiopsis subvermispora (strain B) TaxID=914234 RepID=M2QA49_CERS8|nr:hypothetical protein CERSUDRAFT_98338 [Gelatoporia subvermispora B]